MWEGRYNTFPMFSCFSQKQVVVVAGAVRLWHPQKSGLGAR